MKDLLINLLEKIAPNYLKQADECLQKGDLNKALTFYTKASRFQKNNPFFYFNWGTCWFALNSLDNSVKLFRRAVELKPDFGKAYCQLGLALFMLNLHEEAQESLNKALRLLPNDPAVYINLGLLDYKLGKKNDAQNKFKKVLNLTEQNIMDVNRTMALNQLSIIEMNEKNHPKAAQYLQMMLKINPKFAPGYYNLALINVCLFNIDEACANLKKAFDLDPKSIQKAKSEELLKTILDRDEFTRYLFNTDFKQK